MTFTDEELSGALKEAETRSIASRAVWSQALKKDRASLHAIYREDLATVAALNFLIDARKGKTPNTTPGDHALVT